MACYGAERKIQLFELHLMEGPYQYWINRDINVPARAVFALECLSIFAYGNELYHPWLEQGWGIDTNHLKEAGLLCKN